MLLLQAFLFYFNIFIFIYDCHYHQYYCDYFHYSCCYHYFCNCYCHYYFFMFKAFNFCYSSFYHSTLWCDQTLFKVGNKYTKSMSMSLMETLKNYFVYKVIETQRKQEYQLISCVIENIKKTLTICNFCRLFYRQSTSLAYYSFHE